LNRRYARRVSLQIPDYTRAAQPRSLVSLYGHGHDVEEP
jgi:hypothetical protein